MSHLAAGAAALRRRGTPGAADPGAAGAARVSRFLSLLSVAGGLAVWEGLARELPRAILAPPSAVAWRLAEGLVAGELPAAFGRALAHLALGYALAVAAGVPLGLLMGRSGRAFHLLDPVVAAVYAVPPVAFVPFLVIWFGLFFPARVALVFLMCVFEILLTVAAGARDVDPGLVEVGRSFGARGARLARMVLVPAMLPFLFAGLRVGLVRAVNAMITAELFLAAVNLGGLMKASASRFDTAGLLAVIATLSAFGLLAQEGLKAVEARALPWRLRR